MEMLRKTHQTIGSNREEKGYFERRLLLQLTGRAATRYSQGFFNCQMATRAELVWIMLLQTRAYLFRKRLKRHFQPLVLLSPDIFGG